MNYHVKNEASGNVLFLKNYFFLFAQFKLTVMPLKIILVFVFNLLQGVIETVKDFFSPSWLVDLFKGNQRSLAVTNEDANVEVENDNVSQTVEESSSSTSDERSSNMPCDVSASKVGNGQLRSSLGPGYFSSILRQREEVLSDFPSTSRPSRTFGLSSGFDRLGEPSTSLARSVDFDREVPSSKGEDVHLDTVAVSFT